MPIKPDKFVIVPPVPDEVVEQLTAQHRRLARIKHAKGEYEVVLRKPTRQEFKAFREKIHNPTRKAAAQEELTRLLVVYPTRELFDELLDEYPALCDGEAASNALEQLMNGAREEYEK